METTTLCTTEQIARRYSVHVETVRRWVRKGLITPKLITPAGHPRFDPEEVDRTLAPKQAEAVTR